MLLCNMINRNAQFADSPNVWRTNAETL